MGASKEDIIKQVNEKYSEPIAPKKKDTFKNADAGKHKALMQYKAMLDHIALGAHTKITITKYGRDWNFRLITADEQDKLGMDVQKQAKLDECFEDVHLSYLLFRKTLALALSPTPFKTEGKDDNGDDILGEDDLKYLPMTALESLFKEYINFVDMALVEAENLSEEEAVSLIELIKKKPRVLKELNRTQLLTALHYYRNCLQILEETAKLEQTN